MRFKLFDTAEMGTGTQQGLAVDLPAVTAKDGVFTVTLDFGVAVFDGSPRFLEISVKRAGSSNPLTTLTPRQAITPVPYAIRTLSAAPGGGGIQSDASGNVTIGTNTFPAGVRLNVQGATRISPGGSGGYVQLGTPNGETGLSVIGSNRVDMRFSRDTFTLAAGANSGPPAPWNGVIMNTNGNVGVGMAALSPNSLWKLEVNGPARITPGGSAGGAIQFSTPNTETGLSILGRNRADLRFDDSTVKLVAGLGNGTPGSFSGLAVDTSGRVGVGTANPRGALHVASGGLAVTGSSSPYTGAGAGLFLESAGNNGGALFAYDYASGTARNLLLNTPGGNVGIGTAAPSARLHVENNQPNTAAVYGNATASGAVGVYAQSRADGRAIHAEGNATQAPDKGGFVKAMVYLNRDGGIVRGYNPSGTTTIDHPGVGSYFVDFGFKIDDRFYSITTRNRTAGGDVVPINASFYNSAGAPNSLAIVLVDADSLDEIDSEFMLIVY